MSTKTLAWISVLSLLLSWNCAAAYRPVIIFHGILATATKMQDLVNLIKNSHSGTEIHDIDGFDSEFSLLPMWEQVEGIKEKMLPIMEKASDGVNLICYSQGGLVCRGILQTTPNHNVRSFISLSSPQAGQFGDTKYLKDFFPNFTKEHIYEFFYTSVGQALSIANYWRDPHHLDLYKQQSIFLYPLNHPSGNSTYKANFLEVEDLVLIGGPDDGVITPWQSSHFAFYDENEAIVEMEYQEYYKDDTFGLQTLNSKGQVHVHVIPHVEHIHWHGNKTVYDCCVAPYLK